MSGHDELRAKGYIWTGTGRCRTCGRKVLWYRTFDNKHAPYDPGTFAPHFATCGKPVWSSRDVDFLKSLKILDAPAPARKTDGQLPIDFDAAIGKKEAAQ